MSLFDDMIPEERDEQEGLLPLLRHNGLVSPSLPAQMREQSLQSVKERLFPPDDNVPLPGHAEELQSIQNRIASLKTANTRTGKRNKVWILFNSLAAVLVVGILLSATLFFYQKEIAPEGAQSLAPQLVATDGANGLKLSLSITPGPYFLQELIEANISFTNSTNKTVTLVGRLQPNMCGTAFNVQLSGGEAPHFTLPIPSEAVRCPTMGFTEIASGQTVTVQEYLPLTASGNVTLTMSARILQKGQEDGSWQAVNSLQGHFPTAHIHVSSNIPTNRILQTTTTNGTVKVTGPQDALANLLYQDEINCNSSPAPGIGNMWGGRFVWSPLKNAEYTPDTCEERYKFKSMQLTYMIGAPGYATIVETIKKKLN